MTGDPTRALPHPDLRRVLAPNPSAMTGPGTNTWIVGRGTVAVIDPGPADERHLAAILDTLAPSERVSHILVTHPHADHSALAARLAAATGAPVLAFGTARDGIDPVLAALAEAGCGGEGLDLSFAPDLRLEDGDSVTGPGWRLTAIHTPGHLGSHLCFGWGDLCFSGDHVMGWSSSLVAPPEGDMRAYIASLALLAAHRWTAFLPGHGDCIGNPAARLAELTTHRRQREAEILAALSNGAASATALAALIYTAVPTALQPAARCNVLAHLLDLAQQNLVSAKTPCDAETRFHLTPAATG